MKLEIYEEALASLIKRVDKLEINSVPQKAVQNAKQTNFNLASQSQITYARNLGGDPWEEITKKEISEMIDELKPKAVSKTAKPQIDTANDTANDTVKPKEKPEEGCYPKTIGTIIKKSEVNEPKPLTPEQIEEFGDALM